MVSTLAFTVKIIKRIIFLQSRKYVFDSQATFPLSRNFSIVKELFHSQGTFSQSWKFSTVWEFFHIQGIFPQTIKFSRVKEIFHKKICLIKSIFFKQKSLKKVFYKQRFLHNQKFFCKQRLKRF